MDRKSKEFDVLLLSSIDNALFSLGESVRQSIYFHVEQKFKIPRTEIPQNLESFQQALKKIFGTGSKFIEAMIIKCLCVEMRCPPPTANSNNPPEFLAYLEVVRQNFLHNRYAETIPQV
ncbi:MAG: hypothetical protein NWF05_08515 [Candidatus Bathyarchaeota archaeon]|nr:hypothetical protein [Candidatus Bathyarchaeota archaeon]